jgi:hypothetical protein
VKLLNGPGPKEENELLGEILLAPKFKKNSLSEK